MKNVLAICSTIFLTAGTHLQDHMTDVDYAAQRCIAKDCTCRVTMSEVPLVRQPTPSSVEVFFDENVFSISPEGANTISDFLNKSDTGNLAAIGYTDGCGSSLYNYGLASRRASSARSYIRSRSWNSTIKIKAVSELSSGHDPKARKAKITSYANFHDSLDLKADYYLIDVSGSMSGDYEKWLRAIKRQMRSSAKVYVSKRSFCKNWQSALDISPGGATEIWYSLWHVLRMMPSNSKLIVISDFNSSVPLSNREAQTISGIMSSKSIHTVGITP